MFFVRLLSGAALLIVTCVLFIFGGYPLAGVLLIISLVGFYELSKAFAHPPLKPGEDRSPLPAKKKIDYMDIICYVFIFLYYAAMVFLNTVYPFVAAILCILAILFVYVFSFPKVSIDRIAAVVFSFIYCPVMLSFIYMIRADETYGKYLVWMILISSWGCDTFAYVFGMLFGKKRIFPTLSPKKSLAGCIGGIASSGVLGGLYGYFYIGKWGGYLETRPYIFLITAGICMFAGFMGMLGDLVASGIKRNKGFKDYSKIIPGHGGIMDRFDSTIVVAPVVYALSLFLVIQQF